MPTNITPALATNIPSLPYTGSLDSTGAPQELSLIPQCVATAHMSCWYKYTAVTNQYFIFIGFKKSLTAHADYDPKVQVWIPQSSTYIKYTTGSGGNTIQYCSEFSSTSGYEYFRIPVTPGVTYYFQIVNGHQTDEIDAFLDIVALAPSSLSIPIGALLINDDSESFPAVIMRVTDGVILQYAQFPAGETGDCLPLGIYLTQDGETDLGVVALNSSFTRGNTSSFPLGIQGVRSDRTSSFFVKTANAVFPDLSVVIKKLTAVTLAETGSWHLPSDFDGGTGSRYFTPNRAATRLYAAGSTNNTPIHVYNLSGSVQLADLAVGVANERFDGQIGNFYVDVNGVLVTCKKLTTTNACRIVGYNVATGAEVFSWPLVGFHHTNQYCWYSDSPNYMAIWGYAGSSEAVALIKVIDLATGNVIESFTKDVTGSSELGPDVDIYNAISNSCYLMTITAATIPVVPAVPLSGIYKLVPGKKHDTYYATFSPVTTTDAAIPEPSATTAFIGDEE